MVRVMMTGAQTEHGDSRKFFIDDYSLYNLNEDIIELMIGEKRLLYKGFLEENMKFSEHLHKLKKSNDLFSCLLSVKIKSSIYLKILTINNIYLLYQLFLKQ